MRDVTRPLDNLVLVTLEEIDAAYSYPDWDRVALVVIHLEHSNLYPEVIRLVRMIQATQKPVATLVVGDYGDTDPSVTLLQLGIVDYLTRPLDVHRLGYLVESLTLRARYQMSGAANGVTNGLTNGVTNGFSNGVANGTAHGQFPGESALVGSEHSLDIDFCEEDPILLGGERLSVQVHRVAPQDTTILLSGETGTGKTRMARIIHELSQRKHEPFLVVKCGGLSTHLIESEMFGHLKGSIPGADHDRPGKFAEVGRGTLFLDEIDTLPPAIQAKLLRVVEDREFEPIGAERPVPLQARLIVASNRPLEDEVASGRFRSDLYYRLNVVNFRLPPLREHRTSIATLAHRFLAELGQRSTTNATSLAPATLKLLESYHWPGNLRELRNVIERSAVLCATDEIQPDDLPDTIRRRTVWPMQVMSDRESPMAILPNGSHDPDTFSRSTLAQIKNDAELARISEALRKHSNNRLRAASELGISRMTLYKKLYKYGLMKAGVRQEHLEARAENAG
jgi:DNA-binding NtrC family response regulator